MIKRPHITAQAWLQRPPLRLDIRGHKPSDVNWWWVNCGRWGDGCWRRAPVAIVPYVIRWGPDEWMDMLRRHGRCSACGHVGLTFTHPSWGGENVGWTPFPVDEMAPVPSAA